MPADGPHVSDRSSCAVSSALESSSEDGSTSATACAMLAPLPGTPLAGAAGSHAAGPLLCPSCCSLSAVLLLPELQLAAPPAHSSAFQPWAAASAASHPDSTWRPASAGRAAAAAPQLPTELLGLIIELVLEDDDAQQRRHVAQFVGRSWLAAYRTVAYRRVSLDVGAAVRRLQQRHGMSRAEARRAVLSGLAARLPHATEVVLAGLLPSHDAYAALGTADRCLNRRSAVPCSTGERLPAGRRPGDDADMCDAQFCWQLGEVLLRTLGGSSRLRHLCVDHLPHLHAILAHRLASKPGQSGLEVLGITALPAAELTAQLPLLRRLPLRVLGISDAACLSELESSLLAQALSSLPNLTSLSLGGCPGTSYYGRGAASSPAPPPAAATASTPGVLSTAPTANASQLTYSSHLQPRTLSPTPAPAGPAAGPQHPTPRFPPASCGPCLPSLQLVAAAASLPALQQLELSLTFSKQHSSLQQGYLQQLGCVLRAQRRGAGVAATTPSGGAAAMTCAEGADAGADGSPSPSRVSVTVHEHVQGDLSAVPVASCSLNLDWDDESNPIEVWQCSTLRKLRIAAQLPLQAGQFRPARLAALRSLEIAGCCYIPSYFAEALCSMQQLTTLAFSDCQLEAVAAVPWHSALPALPHLQEVSIQRCSGAVLLPTLWLGLAACARLATLRITGGSGVSTAGPVGQLGYAASEIAAAAASVAVIAGLAGGLHGWAQVVVPPPPTAAGLFAAHAAHATPIHPSSAGADRDASAACGVPDCIALLQQLRHLDLSWNGLHTLPGALAWCQGLTSLTLRGNRLLTVPPSVAALTRLRSLDLSGNQLATLGDGPYLQQLEELLIGCGNLTLPPTALPPGLLRRRRLRRLSVPLWWRLATRGALEPALLSAMPWLVLEHS